MLAPRSAKLFEDEQRFVCVALLLVDVVVLLEFQLLAHRHGWILYKSVTKKNQIAFVLFEQTARKLERGREFAWQCSRTRDLCTAAFVRCKNIQQEAPAAVGVIVLTPAISSKMKKIWELNVVSRNKVFIRT